ncbi:MAG: hypothetical protein Q9219_004340 [cf. Caloplaca sp. 3 TL-2023]
MDSQDDGLDISLLKEIILSSAPEDPDAVADHLHPVRRTPAPGNQRSLNPNRTGKQLPAVDDHGANCHDLSNASTSRNENPLIRFSASQPEPLSTIPDSTAGKMNVLGSQPQGDTQPISQTMLEEFANMSRELQAARKRSSPGRSTGRSTAIDSTSRTYLPGQTGHVDLLGAYQNPPLSEGEESVHEDFDDELGIISQLTEVQTELCPKPKHFHQPKTPASHHKNKMLDADFTPRPQTTPGLPINPFAGHANGVEGLMNSSQLFKATQAPSSPLPVVLPSDDLSDRPSPNLYESQRASVPDTASSPVKRLPLKSGRAFNEPQTTYVSMKESQEERERRRLISSRDMAEALAEASDDGFESDDSLLRRHKLQRKLELESHAQFSKITAQSRPNSSDRGRGHGRGRGRGRGRGSGIGRSEGRSSSVTVPSKTTNHEPVLISDDPSPPNASHSSEEETEQEEDAIQVDISQIEDLTGENKENIDSGGIQVPMTVSKSKDIAGHGCPLLQSPSNQRNRKLLEAEEDNVRDMNSSGKIEFIPRATPTFDVADSQPSKADAPALEATVRSTQVSTVPLSSPDSRLVIPQSQPSDGQMVTNISAKVQGIQKNATTATCEFTESTNGFHQGQNPVAHPSSLPVEKDKARPDQTPHGCNHIIASKKPSGGTQAINRVPSPECSTVTEFPRSENTTEIQEQGTGSSGLSNHQATVVKSTISESTVGNRPSGPASVDDGKGPDQFIVPVTGLYGKSSHPRNGEAASGRSTAFETAYSHVTAASEKPGIQSHNLQTQPVGKSPARQSSRLRTMAEIAAQPTPSDAIGGIDVDIDLMTGEDLEFHSIVSGSSPVIPPRKRRRGIGGRAIRINQQLGTVTSSSPSDSPPTDPGVRKVQMIAQPVVQTESNSPRARNASAPPKTSISNGEESHSPVSDTLPTSKVTRQPHPRPARIRASSAVPETAERVTSNSPNAPKASKDAGQDVEVDKDIGGVDEGVSDVVIAPNRVFAHFNGSRSGYYPATCIGILLGEEPRYKVRFDDGTIDRIGAYGVKQLKLLPGDNVKIDMEGLRTKSYTVERVHGQRRPMVEPDPATRSRRNSDQGNPHIQHPSVDIYGHDSVVVSIKQRQSTAADKGHNEQIVVPLEFVYMTTNTWASYKNRTYHHDLGQMNIASGLPTPSERTSSPFTPPSRSRRTNFLMPPALGAKMSTNIQDEGVFHNMAFTLTSIATEAKRNRIARLVEKHGGKVLTSGFEELFDIPKLGVTSTGVPTPQKNSDSQFRLTDEAKELGFTCLLADKHSRTSKYIQALALGIPCLSSRWIVDCISKQKILPWDAYLLAAGEPAMLEGAVRSRLLTPYSAATARLSTTIDNRAKLLDGMSVLLIMTKAEEKDMSNHPLLTYALGAGRVARAASIEAAANTIEEGKGKGEVWDWVYSHDDKKGAERMLFEDPGEMGKKRKRGRVSMAEGRPKVVGHEFVIQSLILGRLVDVD